MAQRKKERKEHKNSIKKLILEVDISETWKL
jgi:hypothetical protein